MEISSSYIHAYSKYPRFTRYISPGVLEDDKEEVYLDCHSFSCSTSLWCPTLSSSQFSLLPTTYEFNNVFREKLTSWFEKLLPTFDVGYTSSGTDSVVNAIHFSQLYTKKKSVVMFEEQYHGKYGPLSNRFSTSEQHSFYNKDCIITLPSLLHDSKRAVQSLEELCKNNPPSALLLELCSIANAGGLFIKEYIVKEVVNIAKKYNVLIIVDEVQSGFWRTGKLFSYEHYDILPDIISFGKSIAGGLPLYGTFYNKNLLENFPMKKGFYSSTYTASLLATSIALQILNEIMSEENKYKHFLTNIEAAGEIFDHFLLNEEGYFRKGLVISFITDITAEEFLKKKILLRKVGNRVLLTPPLFSDLTTIWGMSYKLKEVIKNA
ncbi:MAG: aminotransferase class III-fold pyridoxal phosphate-dependent enzyme [Methanogenium sp.]|jgi:4-aminobutyrate aminotransferase-like enzyme